VNNKVSVPQIIILASGGVMLIASFLDFFSGESAWSAGLVFVLAAFLGIAMAVVVALQAFANVKLPERVLTLSWVQIHLALAIYAALLMIGWLLLKVPGSVDRGIGFWLMFLAAAGLVVGAVMNRQEAPATGGPSAPPTAF
jgi:amino acid transporter